MQDYVLGFMEVYRDTKKYKRFISRVRSAQQSSTCGFVQVIVVQLWEKYIMIGLLFHSLSFL